MVISSTNEQIQNTPLLLLIVGYRAFYLDYMKKLDKNKVIRRLDKAESAFWKAESDVSALADIIQPFFEQEIQICMSSDGATITDDSGEKGFVRDFLNAL